jgi:hypothetical protein
LQWFCSVSVRARSSRAGSPGASGGFGAGRAASAAAIDRPTPRRGSARPQTAPYSLIQLFMYRENMRVAEPMNADRPHRGIRPGQVFVYQTAAAVPEPGTLAIIVMGLGHRLIMAQPKVNGSQLKAWRGNSRHAL